MTIFCPDIIPAAVQWGGDHSNINAFPTRTGHVRRSGRASDRQRAKLRYTTLHNKNSAAELARMSAFKASLRGRLESFYLPNHAYQRRGSFQASELLSNPTFASGATGWSTDNSSLTAADRILRIERGQGGIANSGAIDSNPAASVAYAPYAFRAMLQAGRGVPSTFNVFMADGGGVITSSSGDANPGLKTTVLVTPLTTIDVEVFTSASVSLAGDYFTVPYTSLARCALADGGGNNLLRSDELDNAAWTRNGLSTVTTNTSTSPDGTVTSDALIENSSNSSHYITQSQARTNVAADLCGYGFFKRGTGTRNIMLWVGNDGGDGGFAVFDLGAGTFSTVTNNGTATNTRAFIRAFGNNWYFCWVVSRLPAAATLAVFAEMANGTATTYTGDGTSSVVGWRVGGVPSSVPTRGSQTTTVAVAPGSQQSTGIHTKGWPVSTDGLLAIDDYAEINGRLRTATAPVNSDAAGLAFLQVGWPVGPGLANDAPIIINRPMAKFMLVDDEQMIDYRPGQFGDLEIDCIEDLTP